MAKTNVINKYSYRIRKKQRDLSAALSQPKIESFPAWLGDNSGNITTFNGQELPDSYVVVRDYDGNLSVAYNPGVPLITPLGIIVGYDAVNPTTQKILGMRDYLTEKPAALLPNHHKMHEWPNGDTVFVHSEQYLPGLLLANTGLVVYIYPFYFKKADGTRGFIAGQSLDLAPYSPASGSQVFVIAAKDDGTLEVVPGATKISLALTTLSDFPP